MEKRNYTHVQMLLPEIEAMIAEGKTQREVAEYFGSKDSKADYGVPAGGSTGSVCN